jgi:hypothetical protein
MPPKTGNNWASKIDVKLTQEGENSKLVFTSTPICICNALRSLFMTREIYYLSMTKLDSETVGDTQLFSSRLEMLPIDSLVAEKVKSMGLNPTFTLIASGNGSMVNFDASDFKVDTGLLHYNDTRELIANKGKALSPDQSLGNNYFIIRNESNIIPVSKDDNLPLKYTDQISISKNKDVDKENIFSNGVSYFPIPDMPFIQLWNDQSIVLTGELKTGRLTRDSGGNLQSCNACYYYTVDEKEAEKIRFNPDGTPNKEFYTQKQRVNIFDDEGIPSITIEVENYNVLPTRTIIDRSLDELISNYSEIKDQCALKEDSSILKYKLNQSDDNLFSWIIELISYEYHISPIICEVLDSQMIPECISCFQKHGHHTLVSSTIIPNLTTNTHPSELISKACDIIIDRLNVVKLQIN